MAFETGIITYRQWSRINRALSNVALELETLPQTGTSEEVRLAREVLSEIHRIAEAYERMGMEEKE